MRAQRSNWDVRFTPESCRGCPRPARSLWATSGHDSRSLMHRRCVSGAAQQFADQLDRALRTRPSTISSAASAISVPARHGIDRNIDGYFGLMCLHTRAICIAASTRPPGVWITKSIGISSGEKGCASLDDGSL
jgi:hypothetical protein